MAANRALVITIVSLGWYVNVFHVCVFGIMFPKRIEKVKDLHGKLSKEVIHRPVSTEKDAQVSLVITGNENQNHSEVHTHQDDYNQKD